MVTQTGQSRIEDELDKMLADSFPASDPPSFTPIIGIGEAAPRTRAEAPAEESGSHWMRFALAGLAGVASIAVVCSVVALRHAKSASTRRRMRRFGRGVQRAAPMVRRGFGALRAARS